jgi:hypothetical protein
MDEKPHIGAILLILGMLGLLFTVLPLVMPLFSNATMTAQGALIWFICIILAPICLLVTLVGLFIMIMGWLTSRYDEHEEHKPQPPDDTTNVSGREEPSHPSDGL